MDENSQNKPGEDTGTNLHRLSDAEEFDGEVTGNGPAPTNGSAQVEALKAELDKAKKDHLYLLAEFENYKKNVIKERSDMRKYGSERLVVDLLNVLDIFDTALKSDLTPENAASFKKGMQMTANELRAVLGRFGVEEIPAEGKPFDPSVHEAISSEATDKVPEGHITQVFKKPFKLYDRVIRPGQVVVSKGKS